MTLDDAPEEFVNDIVRFEEDGTLSLGGKTIENLAQARAVVTKIRQWSRNRESQFLVESQDG